MFGTTYIIMLNYIQTINYTVLSFDWEIVR